jgi:hypothetical protein
MVNESDYFWRLVNTPLHWQGAARDLICGRPTNAGPSSASPGE